MGARRLFLSQHRSLAIASSQNLLQLDLATAVLEPALAHLMASAKGAVSVVVAEAAAAPVALAVEVAAAAKCGLL